MKKLKFLLVFLGTLFLTVCVAGGAINFVVAKDLTTWTWVNMVMDYADSAGHGPVLVAYMAGATVIVIGVLMTIVLPIIDRIVFVIGWVMNFISESRASKRSHELHMERLKAKKAQRIITSPILVEEPLEIPVQQKPLDEEILDEIFGKMKSKILAAKPSIQYLAQLQDHGDAFAEIMISRPANDSVRAKNAQPHPTGFPYEKENGFLEVAE